MSNTEAKFVLNAYRPNGRDAGDATFAEALAQTKNDPALGAWFARAQAHDAAVATKLRAIEAPVDLREAILAGARVSGEKVSAGSAARAWWQKQSTWLAAAAAVALVATVSMAVWPKRAIAGPTLTDFAMYDALEPTKHGGHGPASGQLQAMLANSATKLDSGLQIDFTALKNNGCRTVSVAGHDVLEVCFKRDGQWFHCYVARVEDFPGGADWETSFAQAGKIVAATWSDGAHRFVVASSAGREAVQRLL